MLAAWWFATGMTTGRSTCMSSRYSKREKADHPIERKEPRRSTPRRRQTFVEGACAKRIAMTSHALVPSRRSLDPADSRDPRRKVT
jgi:hypothetical protein